MGSNPLLIIGLVVALGVVLNFIRMWLFVSAVGGNARARASRIADSDAHLSFDERIADRMRELAKEGAAGPVAGNPIQAAPSAPLLSPTQAPAAPRGFGRRGV